MTRHPLNEGYQVADQFRHQKIHRRRRDFHEHNGPFLAYGESLETHTICWAYVIDFFGHFHSLETSILGDLVHAAAGGLCLLGCSIKLPQ